MVYQELGKMVPGSMVNLATNEIVLIGVYAGGSSPFPNQ